MEEEYRQTATPSSPPLVVLEHCPDCGARLVIRQRKADGRPFVSCGAWPACRFAASWDEREQNLAARIQKLEAELDALGTEIGFLEVNRDTAAEDLSKRLRDLVVKFHPDQNPTGVQAHDVACALNQLREAVAA